MTSPSPEDMEEGTEGGGKEVAEPEAPPAEEAPPPVAAEEEGDADSNDGDKSDDTEERLKVYFMGHKDTECKYPSNGDGEDRPEPLFWVPKSHEGAIFFFLFFLDLRSL